MSSSEYKTLSRSAEGEIIEKKSRFIAHVKPVIDEQEALDFISDIRTKYWDATHNVYAYVIGNDNIQRYSDDGEPSGTAGIPVLEVIKKEGLQDIIVVVTRYFGGTLLGTGGLVRAYGKSAKEGIDIAGIITMKQCDIITMKVEYTLLGKVQNELVNEGHIINDILYQEDVTLSVYVSVLQSSDLINKMIDITSGRVNIEITGNKYIAVDQNGKLVER